MTSELIEKTFNNLSAITRDFDSSRKRLIDYQLQVMAGMNNISLMPDVLTLAIHSVDSSSDKSNLGEELGTFVYGLVFMAKAKYQAVVEKNRQSASELLKSAAGILIGNISNLIENAKKGVGNLIDTLRDLFLSNDSWIKRLIEFFCKKVQLKEAKESFLIFVETVLKKISRQPILMNKTKLYSEIAHDHDLVLIQRNKSLLKKEYPRMNGFYAFIVISLAICFVIPAVAVCFNFTANRIWNGINFLAACICFIPSVGTFTYLIFLIKASQKQMTEKETKMQEYKDWLQKIKFSGY